MRMFLSLILFISFKIAFAQPTMISSVTISPAGPYTGGEEVSVTVTVDNANPTSFDIFLRVSLNTTAPSGCLSPFINYMNAFPASSLTGTFMFTMPTGNFTAGGGSCSMTPVSGDPRYVRASIPVGEVGNASAIFGHSGMFVLPIELKSFDIKKDDSKVAVHWQTSSETNNDYFTIERSSDGSDFSSIGMVDGAGDSNTELSYSYTDTNPLSGINYYRIKQTDFDGKYSYTDIRSVRFDDAARTQVSPLVTEGILYINSALQEYTATIINAAGQTVKRFGTLSLQQTIDINDLHAGLYFVRVNSGTTVETIKVLKI
jgi:Secretion system C-terminal sorting domain